MPFGFDDLRWFCRSHAAVWMVFLVLLSSAQAQDVHQARVEPYQGRPAIWVDGKPQLPMIYALTDVPGGRWTWEELPQHNIRQFYHAGFRLFQFDLAFDHVWKADGQINLDTARLQMRGLLAHYPDALIMIRFHVNPPKWWQSLHSEENTTYGDAPAQPDLGWGLQRLIEEDEETPSRTSIASALWLKEGGEKWASFLKAFSQLPEAGSVIGIQVAGGVYGEWHYWGFINNEPDFSRPMQRWFRQWLADKYAGNEQLRAAWRDPGVSLDNAALPTLEKRQNSLAGLFRDPEKERQVIDYYQAQHRSVTKAILHFGKITRETWPRPIIIGAFYGYFYSVFGRETAGGHLDLQTLLASPYIDFLSGPGTYYPSAKEPGDPYRSRSLVLSCSLHGKLWLDEMDQQPPLVPLKDTGYTTSLQASIANTRRNLISPFVLGQGLWFYDFGPSGFNGGPRLLDHGAFGWWDEPTLMKDIGNLHQLLEKKYHEPYRRDADVLLVHSTETFYYVGSARDQSYLGHFINNWVPVAIYRSGVIHDVVSVDDLPLMDISRYKVVVFINTWMISDQKREWIRKNIPTNDRHLVWLYAPAYSNGNRLDKRFIEQITGFPLVFAPQRTPTRIRFSSSRGNLKPFTVFDKAVDPFFIPSGNGFQVHGTMDDDNRPAIVSKKFPSHTSWFLPIAPDQPDFWRSLFREGGAHIYSDSGDIVYSGSGVLSIHSAHKGRRYITLRNGKRVQLDWPGPATHLLDPDSGETILETPFKSPGK